VAIDWGRALGGLAAGIGQVYAARVQARQQRPRKRDQYLGAPTFMEAAPTGPASYVVGGGFTSGGDMYGPSGYSRFYDSGGALALPGGAPVDPWGALIGAGTSILTARFGADDPTQGPLDRLGQYAAESFSPQGCPSWLRPSTGVARPVRTLQLVHPQTGRVHWYRNAGQPLLMSGDLSVARRVNKLLGMRRRSARRARRGR